MTDKSYWIYPTRSWRRHCKGVSVCLPIAAVHLLICVIIRQWKTSSLLQAPAATISFSPFVTNRVFLLVEDSGVPVHRAVIALKTNGPNRKESAHFLRPAASDESDLLLHTLAAQGLLQDLYTGQSRKHQEHASDHGIRREEERISCAYLLLSK